MPKLVILPIYKNDTGKINVIENILPFTIKRVYWIYDILANRGGHAHKITYQAILAIKGSCSVLIKKKNYEKNFLLNMNNQLLILMPEDWHLIENCSKDLVLLVLASEDYNYKDYIDTPVI
jgi:hypothetical protein